MAAYHNRPSPVNARPPGRALWFATFAAAFKVAGQGAPGHRGDNGRVAALGGELSSPAGQVRADGDFPQASGEAAV